jgi:hypothetical protein
LVEREAWVMDEREIEAVKHEADCPHNERNTVWGHREWLPLCMCGQSVDRVRDARGDDEAAVPLGEGGHVQANYGEIVSHHPEGPDQIVAPQDEDHEQSPGESPTPDDDVIVRWECPECGWSIPDENSAGEGQPCEAWMLDDEAGEHGPTRKVRYRRIRSPQDEEARGDDEGYEPLPETPDPFERTMPLPARFSQDEDHKMGYDRGIEAAWECGCGYLNRADRPTCSRCESARSPQGQDHEADQ